MVGLCRWEGKGQFVYEENRGLHDFRNSGLKITDRKAPPCDNVRGRYESNLDYGNQLPVSGKNKTEEQDVHEHHRKKIYWKTLLASGKVSEPVVDTKNNYKTIEP